MTKKSVLIIDKHQFGYLTDTYKWCEYLRDYYNVTIITPRGSKPTLSLNGVSVKVVSGKNKLLFGIKYLVTCLRYMILFNGPIIVVYFIGCDIFKKILPRKKMILDIRTLSVNGSEEVRTKYNRRVNNTCLLYNHITCISEGVRDSLHLNEKRSSILPLGADPFSDKVKEFNDLNLLYVGTLTDRHIEQTILGLKQFCRHFPNVKVKYDIVGDGWYNEVEELNTLVEQCGLGDTVYIHGRIPYNNLARFFEVSNVGISYIPKTSFFDCQPPTKTFEYILSGMVCVATSTHANSEVINQDNGILIDDTPESFEKGLVELYHKRRRYDSTRIRTSLSMFQWATIVKRDLKPILETL